MIVTISYLGVKKNYQQDAKMSQKALAEK